MHLLITFESACLQQLSVVFLAHNSVACQVIQLQCKKELRSKNSRNAPTRGEFRPSTIWCWLVSVQTFSSHASSFIGLIHWCSGTNPKTVDNASSSFRISVVAMGVEILRTRITFIFCCAYLNFCAGLLHPSRKMCRWQNINIPLLHSFLGR